MKSLIELFLGVSYEFEYLNDLVVSYKKRKSDEYYDKQFNFNEEEEKELINIQTQQD